VYKTNTHRKNLYHLFVGGKLSMTQMERKKILTEAEIEIEKREFFNPEFFELPEGSDPDYFPDWFYNTRYYPDWYYSSKTPYGLFTTEYDKIALNSLDYYKTMVKDLGIHDYVYEMYKLNPFDDGLIICNGIIICNELCFFNHNQIVKYFNFFMLIKKFIFHLTDEMGLEKGMDFSCNEWLAEDNQEIRFTVRENDGCIVNSFKSSFIIDTEATEERLQAFVEIEFRDNERCQNYQRAKKLNEILETPSNGTSNLN
jgi:hypothetical protein